MSTDLTAAPSTLAVSEGAWRQSLRIALGSTLGLLLAKVMAWPFGAFFAVYPILLLGLSPVLNGNVIAEFLGSSVAALLAAVAIVHLGASSPVSAALLFLGVSAICFSLMASNRAFLFGALCAVALSVLVHLGSHPTTPQQDLFMAQAVASGCSVAIAALMHALLPSPPRPPPSPPQKPPSMLRHQTLVGTICATLSYIAFQIFDLQDSLSAQAATVLILFPMGLQGSMRAAWTRVKGTLAGSAIVLALQVFLQGNLVELPILVPFYLAAMLLFAVMHARENLKGPVGPATGFGGATALAVLLGQLSPATDLYGVSFYRVSSVITAVVTALVAIYATSWFLNLFPTTRQA